MSSSRYFLANSMKPFMGRLGLSVSLVFLAGDMGGDIMEPDTDTAPVERTADGSSEAMPWRRVRPAADTGPASLDSETRPPGENWSVNSWLETGGDGELRAAGTQTL